MGERDLKDLSSPRVLSPEDRIDLILPAEDFKLFQEMVDGYRMRRIGSNNHTEDSVRSSLKSVYDMVCTVGKPPWEWEEDDFDVWTYDIFKNRRDGKEGTLAASSQRSHQVNIKGFLDYICQIQKFQNLVLQRYGLRMRQICHSGNMMPHVVEREMDVPRRHLTHEEIVDFFSAIDEAIREALTFGSKAAYPFMRDKAMFKTIYSYGLRLNELIHLDPDHFFENPEIPSFKQFGNVMVKGKGAKGSGARWNTVPLTDPNFPPVMTWYLKVVRPHFLLQADPNETALFLTERGTRPTKAAINIRFHKIRELAGIPREGRVPHSLRHSSTTHEMQRFSLTTVQRKHRHVFASTTQHYTHLGDDFVNEEITRAIEKLQSLDREVTT